MVSLSAELLPKDALIALPLCMQLRLLLVNETRVNGFYSV